MVHAFLIPSHPVLKPHRHQPGLTVAPVEEDGNAVMEAASVPDGLSHGLAHVQPLHPFDLDMYPREAHKIGNLAEGQGTAALDFVPVAAKDIG